MCDLLLIKAPADTDRTPLREARIILRNWTDTPPGRFLQPDKHERVWLIARPDCSCGFRVQDSDVVDPLTAFLEPLRECSGVVECLWLDLDGAADGWKPAADTGPTIATDAQALLVAPFDRLIRYVPPSKARAMSRRHA